MPTVFTHHGYRFFFYSNEGSEPAHVHVERGGGVCKFWLRPARLARSDGFSKRDLAKIATIVRERQQEILDAWGEHVGSA